MPKKPAKRPKKLSDEELFNRFWRHYFRGAASFDGGLRGIVRCVRRLAREGKL